MVSRSVHIVIIQIAPLQSRTGRAEDFQAALSEARRIISAMPGYLSHDRRHCLEHPNEYILLVPWASLEAHEVGFRKSPRYQEWKQPCHHFYQPFPVASHYEPVPGTG